MEPIYKELEKHLQSRTVNCDGDPVTIGCSFCVKTETVNVTYESTSVSGGMG